MRGRDDRYMPRGGSWGLGLVERHSTTDQVLHEIRAAILAERIKPSELLPEAALAQAFGTGRSAIREALRQLVQDGLVVSELDRGARVRPILLDDYLARTAIEVTAVGHAIERLDQLKLSELRVAQRRIQAASPVDRATRPSAGLIDADLDFHRAMVVLAGSSRSGPAHEPLAAESQMLLHRHPVCPGADYAGDHQRLLSALESRDPNVSEMARSHLQLTADVMCMEARRGTKRLTCADSLVSRTAIGTSGASNRAAARWPGEQCFERRWCAGRVRWQQQRVEQRRGSRTSSWPRGSGLNRSDHCRPSLLVHWILNPITIDRRLSS